MEKGYERGCAGVNVSVLAAIMRFFSRNEGCFEGLR